MNITVFSGLTAASPKIVWIELTSKCPFDCVFCSRKFDRGSGQHMSFELYRELIAQLEQPEIIRLNYSGESVHYPRLEEAIRLARGTGATTELVSAFSSATSGTVRSLVDGGLDRLSISLHTTDPEQYRRIYKFGSLQALFDRLAELREYQRERSTDAPEVDLAFVAMQENLGELRKVARRARELGVRQVSVHPVIRRRPALYQFPSELDSSGGLLPEFQARVLSEARAAARETPEVAITVARPETPPAGGGIPTCEQNPWETIHVLAGGAVVVCEVQDLIKMGDLSRQSLAEIWQGPAYQAFRREYANGGNAACRECAWRELAPVAGGVALFRGWHPSLRDPVKWSHREACLMVSGGRKGGPLQLAGVLPPGTPAVPNELRVRTQQGAEARVENRTPESLRFEVEIPLGGADGEWEPVLLRTTYAYCPAQAGGGPDLRRLGFGFLGTRRESARRERMVRGLLGLLRRIDKLHAAPAALRRPLRADVEAGAPGVSILIPERDSPQLLARCLEAVHCAQVGLNEPVQIVVVATGAPPASYAPLREKFEPVEWIVRETPLPFQAAVAAGLSEVRYSWVYLLNNDMILDGQALTEVLRLRSAETFAIGSRIEMEDGSAVETNWTELQHPDGNPAELVELDQAPDTPRGCFYAGGGSALFQTRLLRKVVRRTRAYEPFYWEDAEWGAVAWRHGYRSIHCPGSRAKHGGRRTVSRFYAPGEIERIFQRNRLLFHLRNLADVDRLRGRLLALDPVTWGELFDWRRLADTARARLSRALAPQGDEAFADRSRLRF